MIDAIYRAESGTQNRVKAKLSPRTTREFLTSMIPERKIKKGIHNASAFILTRFGCCRCWLVLNFNILAFCLGAVFL